MTDTENIKLLQRIIQAFDADDNGPGWEELCWRTDFTFAPTVVTVNCNDLFAWGCSDCEFITEENIDLLESTFNELKELCKKYPSFVDKKLNKENFDKKDKIFKCASLLWCARYRKRRPQLAYYDYFPEELKPLFDACGTEEWQYGSEAFYDRIERETGEKLMWRKKNQ